MEPEICECVLCVRGCFRVKDLYILLYSLFHGFEQIVSQIMSLET